MNYFYIAFLNNNIYKDINYVDRGYIDTWKKYYFILKQILKKIFSIKNNLPHVFFVRRIIVFWYSYISIKLLQRVKAFFVIRYSFFQSLWRWW